MTMPKVAYFVIEQTGTDQFRAVSESHDVEVLSDGLGFYSNLQAYPKVLPGAVPAIRFPSGKNLFFLRIRMRIIGILYLSMAIPFGPTYTRTGIAILTNPRHSTPVGRCQFPMANSI